VVDSIGFTNLQDVLDAFQGDRNDLGVVTGEQVTERREATLINEEHDLLFVSTTSSIGDGPSGFLANIELGVGEQLNERRDNVVFNDGLNLLLVSGCVKKRGKKLVDDPSYK
jgi:hypothetical protein